MIALRRTKVSLQDSTTNSHGNLQCLPSSSFTNGVASPLDDSSTAKVQDLAAARFMVSGDIDLDALACQHPVSTPRQMGKKEAIEFVKASLRMSPSR